MKKFLTLFFIFFTCINAYAGEDKFINAIKNCSVFDDSGSVTTDGIVANSRKQVLGWRNGVCAYKESISFNGINADILCNFSKSQIQEIGAVADAYFLTLKYSQEKPDTSSLDATKNNPITNVFAKYLQDPSVCKLSGF